MMKSPAPGAAPQLRSAVLRLLPACAVVALLAACAGPAVRVPGTAAGQGTDSQAPATATDAATASPRPGGYYLDDGPGDNPPPDIDAIPDAEPKFEPLNRYANNPYSVFGEDYVPNQKLSPYRKRGLASWYGRRFHGQRTASGERYDMYAMTAAHPTLPIPSYARVTNVANGKAVVVRINDRGPFHANRIIDLSYTAAHKLDYAGKGSTTVEVEAILPDEIRLAARAGKGGVRTSAKLAKAAGRQDATPPPGTKPTLAAAASDTAPRPATPPADDDPLAAFLAAEEAQPSPAPLPTVLDLRGIFLQLGVFTSKDNAESFRDHVRRELAWLGETLHVQPKDGRFRLHLGPYRNAAEAKRVADRIREALDVKPLLVQR